MKKKLMTYGLLMMMLLVFFAALQAWSSELSEEETQMLNLINQVRTSPATALPGYGYSVDSLPEEVRDGLAELTPVDSYLDMPVKRTYVTRFEFNYFYDSETGVEILFENMLAKEMDAQVYDMIFNPDYVSIDVSFEAGIDFDKMTNYYEIKLVFIPEIAFQIENLFVLINYVRANPLQSAEILGIDALNDETQLPQDNLEQFPVLAQAQGGLEPLNFVYELADAANNHAQDMIGREYYDEIDPDGLTPWDRAYQSGYSADMIQEKNGIAIFCNDVDIDDGITKIFTKMIRSEMTAADISSAVLLSPELEDIGIGIAYGSSEELGGLCGDNILLVTIDVALLEEMQGESSTGLKEIVENVE